MTGLDWVVIALYFVLATGIGLAMMKRGSRSLSDYFIGGRALPWWLAGTSMVATTFAADTPLAVTELVARHGVAGNWLWWNMVMSGILTVFFYARLWRRAGVVTDVEFTELRYGGKPAALLRGFRAAYLALPINLIIMGWVNLAMVEIAAVALDIPRLWALLFCFVLAASYSMLAGLWGVVVTDLFQFVLAVGGAIVLAIFAVNAVGGIAGLEAGLEEVYGSSEAALSLLPQMGAAWMPALTFAVYLGMNWWASWYPGAEPGGGGYVAQRIFAARTERDGLLATLWFNIAHYAIRPWPWILVALVSVVLYTDVDNPRQGYILAIMDLLPPGLTGLLLAGFAAAYMSTISTQLNWGASYLVNDLYRRFWRTEAGDPELVAVSRIATGFLMVASLVVTYFMTSIEGAWRFLLAIGAGTGLVLILRWYWWRINAWSEITAMAVSLMASLWLWFGAGLDPDDPTQWAWIMMATVGISTLAWVVVTYATTPESDATLDRFYRRVRPGGPGWYGIAQRLGFGREGMDGGVLNWTNWAAGVTAVYATLFGTGKVIFGEWGQAALFLGIAVVAFSWIARNLARMEEDRGEEADARRMEVRGGEARGGETRSSAAS
ncbi:MAG: sodium:proline symporter [Gemmatimonadales bacterium]|nr:MAG: sodium:proline symporter [Gemmatimonadales bacterium]